MDVIRLGEVCEVLNGFAFKSENYVDSGVRIIRIANVQKGHIEDNTPAFYPIDFEGIDKFMLQEGDLLMSLTGNVGRVAVLAKEFLPAALNQRVACLRMKSNKVLKRYLFHILNSDFFEQQCIQSSKGVAQKNMSTEWLKDYKIPLYSLEEQKEIIAILDNALQIMEERKQQISTLDNLIKARFVEMFGDRWSNDKEWPISTLGEVADFYNGKPHEQVIDENGEYILVTSRCIASEGQEVRRTNELLFPLETGDICMVMSDVPNGKALAKCMYIDCDGRYSLNQRICCFRNYRYNPRFLFYLLNRHEYLLSYNDGDSQTNLRKGDLLSCPMIIPPLELQNQFSVFVSQVDKSKVVVKNALNRTQLLFDSLMQQYFG